LGFTVLAVVVIEQSAGFNGRGNSWSDRIELEITCCPAVVS
jgi:hypothetical protein